MLTHLPIRRFFSPFILLLLSISDYEGWPEEQHELPIDHMTEEHRQLIADKCSADGENAAMPNVPTSLLATAGGNGASAITPIPAHNRAIADGQNNVVVAMAGGGGKGGKGKKKKNGGVTPSPMPPKGAAAKDAAKKQATKQQPTKLSKSAMESHRKWQAEAEKQGGPNAKIVVNKPDAKKLIFDKLHDEFAPSNINGV